MPPPGVTGEGRLRRQLCCMVQGILVEPVEPQTVQLAVAASRFSRRARFVQNIPHSRAEVRATLFRPIEKVPKASPMYHSICPAHTARSRCFVPSFPPIGTASQGTIRVGSSENSMLRPFRRVGRVASWRSLSQQTWRFPRIDSRSIEASSAPTRRGAACARGCRLKAGTPLRSARILSTVAAGGI